MKTEIKNINIIPAIFLKYREDGNALIKCLQGNNTVNRAFEPKLLEGIKDLKYLLIGIITGKNMIQITIKDGNEFKNLYYEKWKILLK